jgi:hypothetical protein
LRPVPLQELARGLHQQPTYPPPHPPTLPPTNQPTNLIFDASATGQDFNLGEHLLLVGNQGVGKNKLTDRLLMLIQREREYIQLHRDTTVPALTLTPTLQDGRIVWEDSPLVRALTFGRVLMVDEADKVGVCVCACVCVCV